MAEQLGLVPVSALGVLVRAKQRRFVGELRPLMDRLQNELNFFISSQLHAEMLRLADESL